MFHVPAHKQADPAKRPSQTEIHATAASPALRMEAAVADVRKLLASGDTFDAAIRVIAYQFNVGIGSLRNAWAEANEALLRVDTSSSYARRYAGVQS